MMLWKKCLVAPVLCFEHRATSCSTPPVMRSRAAVGRGAHRDHPCCARRKPRRALCSFCMIVARANRVLRCRGELRPHIPAATARSVLTVFITPVVGGTRRYVPRVRCRLRAL